MGKVELVEELVKWGGGKFEGKGADVYCAISFEELDFFREGEEELGCGRIKDALRVVGKGEDGGVWMRAEGAEECLVAEVDAVEKADGEGCLHSVLKWGVRSKVRFLRFA